MTFSSLLRIGIGVPASCLILLGGSLPGWTGTIPAMHPSVAPRVELATFWGRPYPYGYAYRWPHAECWNLRRIETAEGPRVERVWICPKRAIPGRYYYKG